METESQERVRHVYWNLEVVTLFAVVTLTFALIFAGFLPSYLSPLHDVSRIYILLLYFLVIFTVARLILCVLFFTRPFRILQWSVLLLAAISTFTWTLYLREKATLILLQEDTFPASTLRIESSDIYVLVKCNGDARVERAQTLIPKKDITQLVFMDFYAYSGFSTADFAVSVSELGVVGGRRLIPSTVEFEPASGRLVISIGKGERLSKDKRYQVITTILAHNAFIDQRRDVFTLQINYETFFFSCMVSFDDGCTINPKRVTFLKVKEAGGVLADPISLTPEIIVEDRIRVNVLKPKVGDQYSIYWEYSTPRKLRR